MFGRGGEGSIKGQVFEPGPVCAAEVWSFPEPGSCAVTLSQGPQAGGRGASVIQSLGLRLPAADRAGCPLRPQLRLEVRPGTWGTGRSGGWSRPTQGFKCRLVFRVLCECGCRRREAQVISNPPSQLGPQTPLVTSL